MINSSVFIDMDPKFNTKRTIWTIFRANLSYRFYGIYRFKCLLSNRFYRRSINQFFFINGNDNGHLSTSAGARPNDDVNFQFFFQKIRGPARAEEHCDDALSRFCLSCSAYHHHNSWLCNSLQQPTFRCQVRPQTMY